MARSKPNAPLPASALHDRLAFAKWHFDDLEEALSEFIAENLKGRFSVLEYFADAEDAQDIFSAFMVRVSAYVTAFVQSLHALEDIAAHMVYYSLALDQGHDALREQDISGSRVQKLLTGRLGCERLHRCLADLDHSSEAKHLDALANISKHRNIVIPMLSEDYAQPESFWIRLRGVTYRGEQFPAVTFNEFAREEMHRGLLLVVTLGNELNAVLVSPGGSG